MATLAIKGGHKAAAGLQMPRWLIEDRKAVLEALDSGNWCRLYPNSNVEQFEKAFAEYHQAKRAIAVSNGTVALELTLLAAGVQPGDEVLARYYFYC